MAAVGATAKSSPTPGMQAVQAARAIGTTCSVSSRRRPPVYPQVSRRTGERAASAATGCGSSFRRCAGWARSAMARRYGIASRAEAEAYLRHPAARRSPRRVHVADARRRRHGRARTTILGSPDDVKFRSSMTLFAAVSAADCAVRRRARPVLRRPPRCGDRAAARVGLKRGRPAPAGGAGLR